MWFFSIFYQRIFVISVLRDCTSENLAGICIILYFLLNRSSVPGYLTLKFVIIKQISTDFKISNCRISGKLYNSEIVITRFIKATLQVFRVKFVMINFSIFWPIKNISDMRVTFFWKKLGFFFCKKNARVDL